MSNLGCLPAGKAEVDACFEDFLVFSLRFTRAVDHYPAAWFRNMPLFSSRCLLPCHQARASHVGLESYS